MLERLRQFDLYCKAENCHFDASKIVRFLGIIITSDIVGMESDHISTIED